jgi:hypothetical protein
MASQQLYEIMQMAILAKKKKAVAEVGALPRFQCSPHEVSKVTRNCYVSPSAFPSEWW